MKKPACVKVALSPSLRIHVSLRPCGKPGGSGGGTGGGTGGNTGGGTDGGTDGGTGGETVVVSGFSDNSGALLADDSGAILV